MQEYSKVAARWWVDQILDILPAQVFWGKFGVSEALAISQFMANVNNGQKEMFINSLAKKIERYLEDKNELQIAYPNGIIDSGYYIPDINRRVHMNVSKDKVEVWPGDGTSKILYSKDKPQ